MRLVFIALLILFSHLLNANRTTLDSLLRLYEVGNFDLNKEVNILNEIAIRYKDINPDSALYYGKTALNKTTNNDQFEELRAWSYIYLSSIYLVKTRSLESLQFAEDALEIFERVNNLQGIVHCYNCIASIHSVDNEYQKSLLHYYKSAKVYKSMEDHYNLARTYANIGQVLHKVNKNDSALFFLAKAMDIMSDQSIDSLDAVVLNIKGDIFRQKNIPDQALVLYSEALEISEALEVSRIIPYSALSISQLHQEMGNLEESIKYASRALELSLKNNYPENIQNSALTLSSNYRLLGNYKKAHEFYLIYSANKDSLFNRQKNIELERLEENFQIKNQQKEIELLTADAQLQKEYSARQQLIVYALLLIYVLAGAVVVVQFRKTRLKQRSLSLLTDQKNRLTEQYQDIERQRQEILQQADLLKEANDFKDKIFSIISHDLRAPLNNLLSMIHIMEEQLMDPSKMPEFTEILNKQATSMLEMINNILFWSKSQVNISETKIENINIQDLILKNIKLYQAMADSKEITISYTQKSNLIVFGDKNQIDCVLRNLINNAVKFTESFGEIEVGFLEDGHFTKIFVRDSGIGISEDKIEQLFKPNRTEQRQGTADESGHGIGLFLCKEFVENCNGKIGAESTEGVGSTFYFLLPNEKSVISKEASEVL